MKNLEREFNYNPTGEKSCKTCVGLRKKYFSSNESLGMFDMSSINWCYDLDISPELSGFCDKYKHR